MLPSVHHRLVLHCHVRRHVVGAALLRRGYNAAVVLALCVLMRRQGRRVRRLLRLLAHRRHAVRVPARPVLLLLLLVVSLRVTRAVGVVIHKQDRVLLLLRHHLLVRVLVVHHLMRALLLFVWLGCVALADWAD